MTLTEVLVVICTLAVLAVLLLPALAPDDGHRRTPCVQNLKQIALAFKVWEGDHGDKYPMQVSTAN